MIKSYDHNTFEHVDVPKEWTQFSFYLDDHNRIDVTIEDGKLRLLGSGENMSRLVITANSSNVIYVDVA